MHFCLFGIKLYYSNSFFCRVARLCRALEDHWRPDTSHCPTAMTVNREKNLHRRPWWSTYCGSSKLILRYAGWRTRRRWSIRRSRRSISARLLSIQQQVLVLLIAHCSFLEAPLHLSERVCLSVSPLVRRSVTLSLITTEISTFEQMYARDGMLGSLDASSHLYTTFDPSVGLSVHQSVFNASVKLSNHYLNQN